MEGENRSHSQQLPTWLGLLIITLHGAIFLPLAQTQFGLWEPWETTWAELARTMLASGDWFDPQLGGKSAPRPLLPIWLIALSQWIGGDAEWLMRWPMALSTTAGAAALFLWLREPFGPRRGLIAALASLTCPPPLSARAGGMRRSVSINSPASLC